MNPTTRNIISVLAIYLFLTTAASGAVSSRQSSPARIPASDDPIRMLTTSANPNPFRLSGNIVASLPSVLQTKSTDALWARNLGLFMNRGNESDNAVALTFDDGPHPIFTPRLLAILRKYDVRATFFVVGKLAEKHPDLIRQIYEDGHVIGNHSYSHPNLNTLTEAEVYAEWELTSRIIESITGERVRYCRPPGGHYNDAVLRAAVDAGLRVVWFTTNTADYKRPATTTIVNKAMPGAQNGSIILLHTGVQQTIEALPLIIRAFRGLGLEFSTVDELQPPYN